jgi:hypothetical protein
MGDSFLFGLMVGSTSLLESRRSILEELHFQLRQDSTRIR